MSAEVEVVKGWVALGCVLAPAGGFLLTGLVFGVLAVSFRRQARQERASLGEDPLVLRPGRVALAGTVENIDGEGDAAPVQVTVEGPSHRMELRPFLLRLASGVRVRVEPGAKFTLRDALEGQVASLTPGELVFVRGVLRGTVSATPNAERATLGGRLFFSTEAFSGELDRRAGALRDSTIVLVVLAVLSQLFYGGFYLESLLAALGGQVPATIVVGIYFWVALISFSAILGFTINAWQDRPWTWRRPRS